MTLWDVLLLWVLAQLGRKEKGPKWPGPGATGPTGPGATGPTGPTGPGATGPTGPGPTGPGGPIWKPYWYIQPDAGKAFGTPYALASEWHGKGTAWSELYNYTKNRSLGDTAVVGSLWSKAKEILIPSAPDTSIASPSKSNVVNPTVPAGEAVPSEQSKSKTPEYAAVGDKLLIPYTWPEPPNATIQARCEPIPEGTQLPGEIAPKAVQGDEDAETI